MYVSVDNCIDAIRIVGEEANLDGQVCPEADDELITVSFYQKSRRYNDVGTSYVWFERRERLCFQRLAPPQVVMTLYLGPCLRPEAIISSVGLRMISFGNARRPSMRLWVRLHRI